MSEIPKDDAANTVGALLASLREGRGDLTGAIRQWQARRRSDGERAVLQRAALTRRFDEQLFERLCRGVDAPPSFEAFIALPEVRTLPRGAGFVIAEDARTAALDAWRGDPDWSTWNLALASFVQEYEPRDVISRLFYLVRADSDQALALFEQEFATAESRFDLAQCFGLLEVLTQAQRDLGSRLALSREAHQQRYRALTMFAADYYRTRTYQQRQGMQDATASLLGDGAHWMLNLHATGGMGKTMFLRWFVAEQVLARRLACARVDFDDVNTTSVARHPWLLLLPLAEQLNAQLPAPYFSDIVDQLTPLRSFLWSRAADSHGSTSHLDDAPLAATLEDDVGVLLLRKFAALLREAGTQVVLVLDTLEGVTLTGDIAPILSMLEELHGRVPSMRVVLAGRYNLQHKLRELVDQSAPLPTSPAVPALAGADLLRVVMAHGVPLELMPFTDAEARTYLRARGIADPVIIDAIVAKVQHGDMHAQSGCLPFTLSLFADLILGRDAITVDEVRALPSSHFVYLVERVIKRISEQPLRWVVRYGALARVLTPDFIEAVLRVPLQEALNGTSLVDRPALQTRGTNEIREPDLWSPDPGASTDRLWDALCRYEAPRGWIWRTGSDLAVQFHGDVVDPMRDLLSSQPIFPALQQRAIAYFEQRAREMPARWADWTCEAIFHCFQLNGDGALGYWSSQLQMGRARGGPPYRRQIAREVLRREYAVDEMEPLRRGEPPVPLISLQTLARGHIETALAILDDNGFLTTTAPDWAEFKRHVVACRRLTATSPGVTIPPALDVQFEAAEHVGKGNYLAAEAALSGALSSGDADTRFGLELHLAHVLAALRDPRAIEHYHAAVSSHPGPNVTTLPLSDVHLSIARWYSAEGDAQKSTAAYESALATASDARVALNVQMHEAWEALRSWDLDRAATLVGQVERAAPDDPRLHRLLVWLSLAAGDPNRAFALSTEAVSSAAGVEQEAFSRDLLAKAEAERMNVSRAFAEWETAIGLFGQTTVRNAVESCWLDRLVVERLTANYSAAASSLSQLLQLPGIRDVEIGARAHIEKMIVERQAGDLKAARATYRHLRAPRERPWPAPLRARVLCHGIALGLAHVDEPTLAELRELLSKIQPASARMPLFEAFQFRAAPFTDLRWRRSLVELIPLRPRLGGAIAALFEAEVRRVCGEPDTAEMLLWSAFCECLDLGHLWGAVRAWQGLRRLRRRRRLRHHDAHQKRLSLFLESSAPVTSFAGAILALEVIADGVPLERSDARRHLLERLQPVLDGQRALTQWHALAAELRSTVAALDQSTDRSLLHAQIALDAYRSLGDPAGVRRAERMLAPPAPPVDTPSVPLKRASLRSMPSHWLRLKAPKRLESIVGHREYDELAEQLIAPGSPFLVALLPHVIDPNALGPNVSARFELTPGPAAALPWEWLYPPGRLHRARVTSGSVARETTLWIQSALATLGQRVEVDGHWGPATAAALARFTESHGLPSGISAVSIDAGVIDGLRRYLGSQPFQADAPILVVKPRAGSADFANVSEESRAGLAVEDIYAKHGRRVERMESPRWQQLQAMIDKTRPAVIHIICAVTERRRVPYLSFERGRQDASDLMTARQLNGMVRARSRPGPFIVLDVARPSSEWDTMRCLLLRNHFAAELAGVEGVGGVLATGLAQSWDVERQADVVAAHVVRGSSQGELATAIQKLSLPRGDDLDRRLAFAATALFSSEPELPCAIGS